MPHTKDNNVEIQNRDLDRRNAGIPKDVGREGSLFMINLLIVPLA